MIVRSEKTPLGLSQSDNVLQAVESPSKKVAPVEKKEVTQAESDHYKVGDNIDCRDAETGAWFEAVIERITANDDVRGLDSLTYHVKVIYYSTRLESCYLFFQFEGYDDENAKQRVTLQQLRPRAKVLIPFMDINPKQEIMVKINDQLINFDMSLAR